MRQRRIASVAPGIALRQELLELRLGGGIGASQEHVDDLRLAIAPRRLVADEIADHEWVVLPRSALRAGGLVDAAREFLGIDVGHAEERRRRRLRQRIMTMLGRPCPPVFMPQASSRRRLRLADAACSGVSVGGGPPRGPRAPMPPRRH